LKTIASSVAVSSDLQITHLITVAGVDYREYWPLKPILI